MNKLGPTSENLTVGVAHPPSDETPERPSVPPRRPAGAGREAFPNMERDPKAPPPKLYKIGEVMQYTGLSRQTIHNYTMLGLITEEARTPSGHRLYGEGVFERLRRIQELKTHLSLAEVRERLGGG